MQCNSPHDLYWLVYDIDRPTATIDWQDLNAPTPTITATSERGHAHLFYGLQVPVITCLENPKVHYKPFRYLAAVDVSLHEKLGADHSFSGLVPKNPLSGYWNVNIWEEEPYTLGRLAEHLDLNSRGYLDGRKKLPYLATGRNCTVFKYTSAWAYKEFRLRGWLSDEFFIYICRQKAKQLNYEFSLNGEFQNPLPDKEVDHIGKSVGKWVSSHFSLEGWYTWGDNRRKKSIKVRQAKAENRNAQILEYAIQHPKATHKEIAELFNTSLSTIDHMKELRGISL